MPRATNAPASRRRRRRRLEQAKGFRGSRSKEMEMPDSKTPQDSPLVEEAVSSFEEPIKLEEQQE